MHRGLCGADAACSCSQEERGPEWPCPEKAPFSGSRSVHPGECLGPGPLLPTARRAGLEESPACLSGVSASSRVSEVTGLGAVEGWRVSAYLTGMWEAHAQALPACSECLCPGDGCYHATPTPRARTATVPCIFQAPTVTIEGFLQALSLAVDKQFEERKKLSSCV